MAENNAGPINVGPNNAGPFWTILRIVLGVLRFVGLLTALLLTVYFANLLIQNYGTFVEAERGALETIESAVSWAAAGEARAARAAADCPTEPPEPLALPDVGGAADGDECPPTGGEVGGAFALLVVCVLAVYSLVMAVGTWIQAIVGHWALVWRCDWFASFIFFFSCLLFLITILVETLVWVLVVVVTVLVVWGNLQILVGIMLGG